MVVDAIGPAGRVPMSAAPPNGFKVPPSKRERHLVDLAEAVAAGRYRPDPGRIAQAMVHRRHRAD